MRNDPGVRRHEAQRGRGEDDALAAGTGKRKGGRTASRSRGLKVSAPYLRLSPPRRQAVEASSANDYRSDCIVEEAPRDRAISEMRGSVLVVVSRVTSALTQRTHRLDPRSLACARSHVGTRDKKRNGELGNLSLSLFSSPLPSRTPPKEETRGIGADSARKRREGPGRRGEPLASHSRLGQIRSSRNICLVGCN